MLRVDRCRDMDKLINFWARSGSRNRIYTGLLHFSGISEEVMGGFSWIWMKCCVSTDIWTWTNWLTFEPDPDHSPYLGTGFTPDFWILTGYLKKLWTDFDEILCVDSCGGTKEEVHVFSRVFFTSDKRYTCFARVRLSVCEQDYSETRASRCIDLNEILRVDTRRDMDELINFWARSVL